MSNISKVARKYLYIDDNNIFYDIDVVNCQPLLLCYLLKSLNLDIDNNYIIACQEGKFYESFRNCTLETRPEIKRQLYKNIFLKFRSNAQINKEFKELYPNTYKSLEILNQDKDHTLASKLQNIEAKIFNDIMSKQSQYYYTFFDSIYFTDSNDCIQLMQSINTKFLDYDIYPMLVFNCETENDIDEDFIEE